MSAYRPADIGMPLAEVDTPALLLDLDAFERNLERLDASLAGRTVQVRPHAKTHKCAEIALRQIARGAAGVCCQKVSEAEALVEGGVADVLIANEVVGARKLARLAALAARARVAVCADHAANVAALDEAARAAGARLDVLVEVDVGAGRCGVEPGEPVAALARAGLACERVTGAGTGTYAFEAASGLYTEIQPGSYIFMDEDYARNEWEGSGIPRFEQSLFVWTTVMSRPTPQRAVVDAGLKALSVDSGLPRVAGLEGVRYARASDEHGVLEVEPTACVALGDQLRLVPGHCDPTVNLYDHYVCVRGGRVEAIWPITARGAVW